MRYTIYYKTDKGERFFERVDAESEKGAERKLREKYNDVASIFQVSEG